MGHPRDGQWKAEHVSIKVGEHGAIVAGGFTSRISNICNLTEVVNHVVLRKAEERLGAVEIESSVRGSQSWSGILQVGNPGLP